MKKATAVAKTAKAKTNSKKERVETVDEYLAAVPEDMRTTLSKLRETIKATAPSATEIISYQIPAYKQDGLLVGFAASKNHCTFHIMSTKVTRAHAAELKDYEFGKASIRFPADKLPPNALVRKLIKARIAENETGRGKKGKKY